MKHAIAMFLMRTFKTGWMRQLQQLEANERLIPEELEARARERLQATLRHACAQVPFYREWAVQAGLDPAGVTVADLERFPLMNKSALMDRQERFLADDAGPADRIPWQTGGSSGLWFRFVIDRRSFDVRAANALRGAMWAGWRPGDRQAVLWGHLRDNRIVHSWRGQLMAAVVHRSLNLNVYDMDETDLEDYGRRLCRWRPKMIRGYASSLAYVADYLMAHGVEVPPPAGIISTAETLTDQRRASIESCFRCKVLNRYGSREFADVAQQCEVADGLHIFTDRVHVEIVRPDGSACEPGERGEIVITDLENRAMPFIRYRTGDLARSRAGTCRCGRGYPLLDAVEGRTSELLVGKNGKIYTLVGPSLFGANLPGIAQMQLVQTNADSLKMLIVANEQWQDAVRRQLAERCENLLGAVAVEIELVDRIAPLPSGKTPFIISEVVPQSWNDS